MRTVKFCQAILEASDQLMQEDESVYLIGLGTPDPKGVFGTTTGLQAKYGEERVMDMPTSENAMTGIVIGSAIKGLRPIMAHQRVDFFILALDQLINNAAKWFFMFGQPVPIVIRLLIGKGWGQGPQHSQTLMSLFAHIPGLKVVAPSNPYDAKGLLIAAVRDNNPVVFLEHRWLHNISGEVPEEPYAVEIGKAKIVTSGHDLTLVASSHLTLEAYKALSLLTNLSIELIDLRTIRPLDSATILTSVRKTGRLLVLDPDWKTGGLGGEIIAQVSEALFGQLKVPPARLTYPDYPCATTWTVANRYYPTPLLIAAKIYEMMGQKAEATSLLAELEEQYTTQTFDVPDPTFTGPF